MKTKKFSFDVVISPMVNVEIELPADTDVRALPEGVMDVILSKAYAKFEEKLRQEGFKDVFFENLAEVRHYDEKTGYVDDNIL